MSLTLYIAVTQFTIGKFRKLLCKELNHQSYNSGLFVVTITQFSTEKNSWTLYIHDSSLSIKYLSYAFSVFQAV